ncbi:MAG: GDSL-type esterase/lipase family protein [Asticcacaulis sp.]|uniref:GDSL-type esterase/lipase family protein n=1 Tax=Asticcacaulis sp. TaxID=1872648 RepID=UPI0039E6DCF0
MTDIGRRHIITGALAGGAALAVASKAGAQTGASVVEGTPAAGPAPQLKGQPNAEAQGIQSALQDFNDPKALAVQPVGNDWAQLRRYHLANIETAKLPDSQRRVVMMGDSITDGWPGQSGNFYADNGLIGRGIGGQVSAQMLVRFMADVVGLGAEVVHIMAGTNDIAQNQDPYDPVATTNNLQAMASLASIHGIKVILASVPPADHFPWRPEVGNPVEKIRALNVWIKSICEAQGYTYVDYWPALATANGSLRPNFGNDGVHPNAIAYAAMAPYTLAAIDTAMV